MNNWMKYWNDDNRVESDDPQVRIGRTKSGDVIDDLWMRTLEYISNEMDINKDDNLLDVCAGSGCISIPFSSRVKSVKAIDISEKLMIPYIGGNISHQVGDINNIEIENKFSKVIIYFALQYFTLSETVRLFKKIFDCLEDGGIFYCGDIPNESKKFDFYDTPERKDVYFNTLYNDKTILGYWFTKEFLEELGKYTGFKYVEVKNQPDYLFNSEYRFDIILKK